MPLIITAVNGRKWGSEANGLATAILCFLVAIPVVNAQGFAHKTDWFRTGLIMCFIAIFTYNLFWKPSQIAPNVDRAGIQRIGGSTSSSATRPHLGWSGRSTSHCERWPHRVALANSSPT